MEITEQIICARQDYLRTHIKAPQKIFLDIRGMHDLWKFVESTGVMKQCIPDFKSAPKIMAMEVDYDPSAVTPYAK